MDQNEKGVWRTINGAHVFIRDGETAEEAIARQTKEKPKRYQGHHAVVARYGPDAMVIPEGEVDDYLARGYHRTASWLDPDPYLVKLDEIDFTDPDITWQSAMDSLQDEGLRLNLYTAIGAEVKKRIAEAVNERNERILGRIPKAEPTFVEDASLSINRSGYDESVKAEYKTPEYAKYTHNCQRCAQAFTLRWVHGLDVKAKPCDSVWKGGKYADGPEDTKLDRAGWTNAIFNKDDYKSNTMTGSDIAHMMGRENASTALMHKQITKIVAKAGPGACYQCSVEWRGHTTRDGITYEVRRPGAHIFNIVNDGGTVKFVDPQDGSDAAEYFDPKRTVGIRPSTIKLTRVDTCRLDLNYIDLVCDYERKEK